MGSREVALAGVRFSGTALGDCPPGQRQKRFAAWEHDLLTAFQVALDKAFVAPTLQLKAIAVTLAGLPRDIYQQGLKTRAEGGQGWLADAAEEDAEVRALKARAEDDPESHDGHTWEIVRYQPAEIVKAVIEHLHSELGITKADNSRELAKWRLDPADWAGSAARLKLANQAAGSTLTDTNLAVKFLRAMPESTCTRVRTTLRLKGTSLQEATLTDIVSVLNAEEEDEAHLLANAPEMAGSRQEAAPQPKPRYPRVAALRASGPYPDAPAARPPNCRLCGTPGHDASVCYLRSDEAFASAPGWLKAMGATRQEALEARLSRARVGAQSQRGEGGPGRGQGGRNVRFAGRGGRHAPVLPLAQARTAAATSTPSGFEALAEQVAALAAHVSDLSARVPQSATSAVALVEHLPSQSERQPVAAASTRSKGLGTPPVAPSGAVNGRPKPTSSLRSPPAVTPELAAREDAPKKSAPEIEKEGSSEPQGQLAKAPTAQARPHAEEIRINLPDGRWELAIRAVPGTVVEPTLLRGPVAAPLPGRIGRSTTAAPAAAKRLIRGAYLDAEVRVAFPNGNVITIPRGGTLIDTGSDSDMIGSNELLRGRVRPEDCHNPRLKVDGIGGSTPVQRALHLDTQIPGFDIQCSGIFLETTLPFLILGMPWGTAVDATVSMGQRHVTCRDEGGNYVTIPLTRPYGEDETAFCAPAVTEAQAAPKPCSKAAELLESLTANVRPVLEAAAAGDEAALASLGRHVEVLTKFALHSAKRLDSIDGYLAAMQRLSN